MITVCLEAGFCEDGKDEVVQFVDKEQCTDESQCGEDDADEDYKDNFSDYCHPALEYYDEDEVAYRHEQGFDFHEECGGGGGTWNGQAKGVEFID